MCTAAAELNLCTSNNLMSHIIGQPCACHTAFNLHMYPLPLHSSGSGRDRAQPVLLTSYHKTTLHFPYCF